MQAFLSINSELHSLSHKKFINNSFHHYHPISSKLKPTMMRSMTILSTTVAVVMASESASVADVTSASAAAPQQEQELWYPSFASDYESGSCTTKPSPALFAFANGAVSPSDLSTLAQEDKESCCETWFPEQEACGCLGGCSVESADDVDAAPTASLTAAASQEQGYWYPQFDVTYEAGKCVKIGVNTNDAPPGYYTKEGGFLHASLDSCCEQWFGLQETNSCVNVLDEIVSAQVVPTASLTNGNVTRQVVDSEAVAPESVAVPLSLVTEETL